MAKNKNYQMHRFFCIKCGNEGIPIPRKQGHQHGRFHRKKLYCPHCKVEINCVECKSDEDIFYFKEDFANGFYKEECEESLKYIKGEN